jgi:hypothetical protein
MATTMYFYTREVTLTSFRSNLTISHISDLTEPKPVSFSTDELSNYRLSLRWLLDYAAADIPAPSSIIETFWTARAELENPFISSFLLTNFRSILAFPVYFFNSNSYGNPELKARVITENLPSQFYVKATVAEPHIKIRFDIVMLALFAILQGAALMFLWAVLAWMIISGEGDMSAVSSFPLFDFGFKVKSEIGVGVEKEEIVAAGDKTILRMSKGIRANALRR